MTCRHPARPLPTLWLMTDERQGDALWAALDRLPRGGGVIVRHYGLPAPERRALFARIRRIGRARGLVVLLAGSARTAVAWRADGVHGDARRAARPLLRTAPAHAPREMIAAARGGVQLLFLSPVFATRSHPGAAALGPIRFGLAMRHARTPVAALGGMTAARARSLKGFGISGWAAIDAWSAAPDGVRT